MNDIIITAGSYALTWRDAMLGFGVTVLILLVYMALSLVKTRRERLYEAAAASERAREMDDKLAELNRIQAEMTGRMQTIAEVFGSRQSDFVRTIGERIDGLQQRVGQNLESGARHQAENLSKLNERLAVIDAAQKNLRDLTGEVVNLKDVLANKQTRGAYGQGRMEAIIRDGLPAGFYEFQATLSNRTRPDCVVTLPGDERKLVIDAKFPFESFTQLRSARDEDMRSKALARIRTDIGVHIKDISEKYFIAGETQDMALLFVPAESLYADLQEHCEDVVQKAHRARIMIVSPSLLSLAIQVMQSLVRDARVREEARVIQSEVAKILEDVTRLRDRVEKLDTHFRQAQDDVTQIKTSADKITRRGQKIENLEFDEAVSDPKEVNRESTMLPFEAPLNTRHALSAAE
jgi:DNA recombination protein RmuC